MGAATQIRVLGGTIGLAVCSALLSNHIARDTAALLSTDQQRALLDSFKNIQELPSELQIGIRQVYAEGYSQQMRVMLYFCVASLVSLTLLAEWPPRKLQTDEKGEIVVKEKTDR
jgi:hypothetical protein